MHLAVLCIFKMFAFLSLVAFPGSQTHDFGITSNMLYCLSFKKAKQQQQKLLNPSKLVIY